MTEDERNALYARIAEETSPGGAMALRVRLSDAAAQGQAEETLASLCDRIDDLECALLDHCVIESAARALLNRVENSVDEARSFSEWDDLKDALLDHCAREAGGRDA